ncbi:zinc ribbon domain-containing protein [Glutamicibacter soli]
MNDDAAWLVSEIAEAKRLASANGRPQLANSAIESGKIEEYDQDGTLVQIVGEQHDGTHAPVTVNGPPPPEPAAPVITAGISSVEARWSGKFAADALSPMDFSHVALHAARAEVFAPSNETQLATITGELGDVAVVLLDSGEWTFGLVAVSKAGKWSPLSETVTIDVPDYPSPVDIQDELIRFDDVTGGLLTEAGNLGNRLDEAEQDLAAHETRLGANDATLANLTGTVLPQLQTDLNKAKTDLAPLPGLIQQNTTKVNEAKTRLDTLDSSTLPGLTSEINNAKTRLSTAETAISTTLPTSIANAKAAADMALLIAPVSTAAPTLADGSGRPINAIWTRIDASGNEIGYWRWTASGWAAMAMTATVIPNLSAAKITSGTIATARLDAAALAVAIASIIELNADRITSGKIAAAQIDVANLAAEIATVIQLNAGSITAGTLSTDRLDANAVAAKVATVIQLNASRITAGTINTARLNVSEIAAQVASVIQLNADRITAGTIATARLNAVEIAAATAAFQTVDVKNLFVTTGTMTEAVINKLWADVVMSQKITAKMIAVGDFQNLATIDAVRGVNTPTTETIGDYTFTKAGQQNYVFFKERTDTVPFTNQDRLRIEFDAIGTAERSFSFNLWAYPEDENGSATGNKSVSTGVIFNVGTTEKHFNFELNLSSLPATAWKSWTMGIAGTGGFNNQVDGVQGVIGVRAVRVYRMNGAEMIIDGSLKAVKIDTQDLAANTGFIADLTARIVKSEMFVGKEFQGGTFTGSVFQTSGIANVGLKLDSTGFRAYGPDGGEPVTEIRSDGGTVYSVTDSATGEVLAAIDSEGGFTGQSLAIAGEARIDGALVTGSDPLTSGHGSGDYGTTMNGRDVLGAAYMEAVNLHPDMQDGNAWLTMAPHGMKINAWNSRTNNLGSDNRWGWASGETRMMLTATMEAWPGRQYLLAYRTPAVRETSAGGSGDLGAALVRYASGTGVVNAGKGSAVPGTQVYLARGGGYQEAAVTTMLRCPEDIPEGRIMFGVEIYTYVGRTAQSTDTPGARRWELSVIDMGMRISANSGEDIDYRTGGVEPSTPDPAPKPKPAREYMDTIDATWWQAYTGDGAKATHSTYSGSASQGRSPYAPGNGVMRGLVGFPSQLTRLSNATVKKIEVYVYAKHWHSSAGGTACIGVHNHASAPTSWSSASNDVKRQKLKKPEGRWITLPSSVHAGFKNGNTKGISFLPASSSTSSEYYGLFKGNKTKLRITYTK